MLRISFALAACVCVVALTGLSIRTKGGQQDNQQPKNIERVVNNIQALQVESVTDAGVVGNGQRMFKVAVVNASGKGVVEYIYLKKDGSTLRTSGATTGWGLAPGETDVVTVSVSEGENLTLAAVLFADGTGEGDAHELARMKDYRAGVQEQYKHAEPILRQVMKAPDTGDASLILQSLENQLSALPLPPAGGNVSPDKASGMHDAKQFIELSIKPDKNRQSPDGVQLKEVQSKVGQVLKHVEKALTKFRQDNTIASSNDGRR